MAITDRQWELVQRFTLHGRAAGIHHYGPAEEIRA